MVGCGWFKTGGWERGAGVLIVLVRWRGCVDTLFEWYLMLLVRPEVLIWARSPRETLIGGTSSVPMSLLVVSA
jgi:hypothetical protein